VSDDQKNNDPMVDGSLDGVEDTLLQLRNAEQAGVFRRSKVNVNVVRDPSTSLTAVLRPWRLPVAAALLLAVTFASFMYDRELGELRDRRNELIAQANINPCHVDFSDFSKCFVQSGPAGGSLCDNRNFDFDADGDVDLHDFSSIQLKCDMPLGG
jgi:hypothetical protein